VTTRVEEEQVVRRQRAPIRARPRLLGELVIIAALLVVYDRVRSLAAVRSAVADSHGWAILDMESVLHLRIERALNSWLTQQGFIRVMAIDFYQYLHVSVTLAVLVVCYVRRPAAYRPARNALVLTNVVGLAVFAVYPVAPPRLLPGAGFVDSVAAAGFGSSHGLSHADLYGALPSLHLAWAAWVAVTGFTLTRRRLPRLLFVAYPILTAIVVVATANHYVLDVASGALLGIAAAWAGGLLPRRVNLTIAFIPDRQPSVVTATRSALGLKPPYPVQKWSLGTESPDP
jgi:hypothetical protein